MAIHLDEILKNFENLLSKTPRIKLRDYSSLKQQVVVKEMKNELAALKDMLQNQDTFVEEFKKRCVIRANSNRGTALSFSAMPNGATNELYWQIARLLFNPETLSEMLSILMPEVTTVININDSDNISSAETNIQEDSANSNVIVNKESLLTSSAGKQLCPDNLQDYVIAEDSLLLIDKINRLSFDKHQQLYDILTQQYPQLATKLYTHNVELQRLEQDLLFIAHRGQTAKDAISCLIKGLILGGKE